MLLALLLLESGNCPIQAEEVLPKEILKLTQDAYNCYSARKTEQFFEVVNNVKKATEFTQY